MSFPEIGLLKIQQFSYLSDEHTKPRLKKNSYKKVGLDLKLKIIDEIHNGRISINHASDKYQVSRTSI